MPVSISHGFLATDCFDDAGWSYATANRPSEMKVNWEACPFSQSGDWTYEKLVCFTGFLDGDQIMTMVGSTRPEPFSDPAPALANTKRQLTFKPTREERRFDLFAKRLIYVKIDTIWQYQMLWLFPTYVQFWYCIEVSPSTISLIAYSWVLQVQPPCCRKGLWTAHRLHTISLLCFPEIAKSSTWLTTQSSASFLLLTLPQEGWKMMYFRWVYTVEWLRPSHSGERWSGNG